ncbi:TetR/AcrR family transcriptional regulator [Actinomycetospora lutea]|uniref:TetR/AcrR family transcriptional regulator n=1 Tax=Actinomycetospora lutea TaxID=663604 RepID=UPI0023651FC6|nr:TetR/AcrR family transcriptional regulator [Actinomycetospora lutea]MDD7940309.1 TetR/AcrR family transcriptional regulator [Actinomycetospora lutea]
MPRPPDPAVRTALIEQAAAMLVAREPVTLRALATRVGTSTMAVYTHFDGMTGLWGAVRQEGFARLARRLADVAATDDPVRDLAALGAAYAATAIEHPALYRAMFDAVADLPDPEAAGAAFGVLVAAAGRALEAGRFRAADPAAVATRQWASGHGLILLVISDVLPRTALDEHAPALLTAIFSAAGDDPPRCAASVRAGWG